MKGQTRNLLLVLFSMMLTACFDDSMSETIPPLPTEEIQVDKYGQPLEYSQGPYEDGLSGTEISNDEQSQPPENIEISTLLAANSFTAATWNLHTLTSNTRNKPVTVFNVVNKARGDAVFDLLDNFSIEIAALQEVYLLKGETVATNFPINKKGANGFTVLPGRAIRPYRGSTKREYCPIVYKENLFNCTTEHTGWQSEYRAVHWARCKMDAFPTKKFYFGCGHFDTDTSKNSGTHGSKLFSNIYSFFVNLTKKKKRPTIGIHKGLKKDSFIFGVDANAHYHGKNKNYWTDSYNRWLRHNTLKKKPPVQRIIFENPDKPSGVKGSKIYKKTNGSIEWSSDGVIDMLFHSLNVRVDGIGHIGPKEVINVPQANLPAYYVFSDHLAIKDEFSY